MKKKILQAIIQGNHKPKEIEAHVEMHGAFLYAEIDALVADGLVRETKDGFYLSAKLVENK